MEQERAYLRFLKQIRTRIAPERVYTDPLHLLAGGTDAGFYQLTPRIIVCVQNEQEVCETLQAARREKLPVTFRAAGTSLSGQSISDSILIQVSKEWDHYQIKDDGREIVLQPALTGERVNRALRPLNRIFTPDPASVRSATVGGIIANNASGMSCSTTANSHKMIRSARIVFADGAVLDTADESSRSRFCNQKPGFLLKIEEIRDNIRQDRALSARIRKKYSIKNVVGLNLLPFVEYDDPFEIITHLMVGSEGTLAFLSQATLATGQEKRQKATALVYCHQIAEACRVVQQLKRLPVQCAELFDETSLRAVEALLPVEIQQQLATGAVTALLIETRADDRETLDRQTAEIETTLSGFRFVLPLQFTHDGREQKRLWNIRSGIFPSVGGMRPRGTTSLIEDVAFPLDRLPEATLDLQQLIRRHHYHEGAIYGHALDGNYHFILNQRFDNENEVKRYRDLMNDVARLVVEKYDGSLKAEHGTGRNMAPYVRYEWGEKAYRLMQEVKTLFDPDNLLNPGVIFNDDPECHLKHFKAVPVMDNAADHCIECGFCETNCMSHGLTLSSRQRIVIRREISLNRSDAQRKKKLEKAYRYAGNTTCAGDGLCALGCPMKINVADLTHALRAEALSHQPAARAVLQRAGESFGALKKSVRAGLAVAHALYRGLGETVLEKGSRAVRKITLGSTPVWNRWFPRPCRIAPNTASANDRPLKVVYFPSCINQTMGVASASQQQKSVVETTIHLLEKAGYQVLFPPGMDQLCCGTIWESKGLAEEADRKTKELETALLSASESGKYPVLCDQSPCLYRMRHTIAGVELYEPVEFIDQFLTDRLLFEPKPITVAVHPTCSTKKMELDETLIRVAGRCAATVICPDGINCCGFAGDKGFFRPEVNAYALRHLKAQIEASGATAGYSNSRTCEIGLSTHSGIEYLNIVYLVDQCTRAKGKTE